MWISAFYEAILDFLPNVNDDGECRPNGGSP